MQVTNGTKFNIFIALSFIGLWTCNYFKPKEKKQELVIDNIHINKNPCIGVIKDLFGKGVDSTKICDCLIPKFYALIKSDTNLVERFKESYGIFKLDGSLQDSAISLMASCVRTNIVDTNSKFHLTPEYSSVFKRVLKKGIETRKEFANIEAENFSSCIIDRLSGNITIKEYVSNDYFEVPKIKKIMTDCLTQSSKHK